MVSGGTVSIWGGATPRDTGSTGTVTSVSAGTPWKRWRKLWLGSGVGSTDREFSFRRREAGGAVDLELDHLIVFTDPGAPVVDHLERAGFRAGTPNDHPGQGTANRRVFFDNAYMEFVFVTDPDALASPQPQVVPTGLGPRFEVGCALGVALRAITGHSPGFPSWQYRPPYLPAGASILMATSSNEIREPLIAVVPFGQRPDRYPSDRAQPLGHPAGPRSIRSLHLAGPWPVPTSPALTVLAAVPEVTVTDRSHYQVQVLLGPGREDHIVDLRPAVPMLLLW